MPDLPLLRGPERVLALGLKEAGSDEGDQVEGDGDAELQEDGSLTITFSWHNVDAAILTAKRDTSSTAC